MEDEQLQIEIKQTQDETNTVIQGQQSNTSQGMSLDTLFPHLQADSNTDARIAQIIPLLAALINEHKAMPEPIDLEQADEDDMDGLAVVSKDRSNCEVAARMPTPPRLVANFILVQSSSRSDLSVSFSQMSFVFASSVSDFCIEVQSPRYRLRSFYLSGVEVELREFLDMPSKSIRLTEASLSQGLVPFLSGRRVPLSHLSVQHNRFPLEREYVVLPCCPFTPHVARFRLVNVKVNFSQGFICFFPRIVGILFVNTDRRVVCIRNESHPKFLSVHPVEQFLRSTPERQTERSAAQCASLPLTRRDPVLELTILPPFVSLLYHSDSSLPHKL